MGEKAFKPELLPKLVTEYEKLAQAQDLLEAIWCRMDPYSGQIKDELPSLTMQKLRDHFGFDDSE